MEGRGNGSGCFVLWSHSIQGQCLNNLVTDCSYRCQVIGEVGDAQPYNPNPRPQPSLAHCEYSLLLTADPATGTSHKSQATLCFSPKNSLQIKVMPISSEFFCQHIWFIDKWELTLRINFSYIFEMLMRRFQCLFFHPGRTKILKLTITVKYQKYCPTCETMSIFFYGRNPVILCFWLVFYFYFILLVMNAIRSFIVLTYIHFGYLHMTQERSLCISMN